jgi:ParB family chromosome partitioning protein
VKSGAISAMGASLQQLAEGARNAQRLQDQITAGTLLVEIDPGEIEDSFVADRIPMEDDPGFEALVASMRESGQQVPVLLRPHPDMPGRYQIAYGHRRVKAAGRIGIRVKALVRALSDSELVIAQGKENLERRDLSFIERAVFAARLEDRGFDRATIVSALSSDKGDVSRYIAVARSVPEDVVRTLGPAPKAGRARWMELAERVKIPGSDRLLSSLRHMPEFRASGSDERFARYFAALEPKKPVEKPEVWTAPNGRAVARIERGKGRVTLAFDEKAAPEFGDFVLSRLAGLHAEFVRATSGGKG